MKRTILLTLVLVLAWAGAVMAAPFLVSGPDAGASFFNVSGLPSAIAATGLVPDPSGTYGLKLDLATLAAGSYTVTVTACLTDPIWGQVCSAASSPFSFTRPAAPPVPAGLALSVK